MPARRARWARRATASRSPWPRSTAGASASPRRRSASPSGAFEEALAYAQRAQAVRPADRRPPGHPVQARRHGHRARRRAPAHLEGGLGQGQPGALHARGGAGQALRLRDGAAGDQQGAADPRRLRLHHASTTSSATSATRASPRSTRGRARSSGWSSPTGCSTRPEPGSRRWRRSARTSSGSISLSEEQELLRERGAPLRRGAHPPRRRRSATASTEFPADARARDGGAGPARHDGRPRTLRRRRRRHAHLLPGDRGDRPRLPVDRGVTMSVSNSVCCWPIVHFGSEELKRSVLPPSSAAARRSAASA